MDDEWREMKERDKETKEKESKHFRRFLKDPTGGAFTLTRFSPLEQISLPLERAFERTLPNFSLFALTCLRYLMQMGQFPKNLHSK